MASKEPKSTGDKKNNSADSIGSSAELGLPDDIFPLVLTSGTQELFECRIDKDVTRESPYKILRKEEILKDIKTRAAVSDFHPIKQTVLSYPGEDLLLVFDSDFTYGQNFYLVLSEESKTRMTEPPVSAREDTAEGTSLDSSPCKTPETQPWVSLGSEREIEEESVRDSRPRLKYRISRVRRKFGAAVTFTHCNALESKDKCTECTSYHDKKFSTERMEITTGVQAVPTLRSISTQTRWSYPRNMCSQYEFREFTEEEKENISNSENVRNFINSVVSRFEVAAQQNMILDVFFNDWQALNEEDGVFGGKAETHLKEYQSFTDLHFTKEKTISDINWHPTINGLIAVSVMEKLSSEGKINGSAKLLQNPPLIFFWSFSDPINPQLLLECPDDVLSFQFCPSNPNIIVGGCMNGQVVLWDVSAYADRLQGTRSAVGKATSANECALPPFQDKRELNTPVVRYCAVSGMENGHKARITDVQWLPENFEISKTGVPVENKARICVQVVTCAPDCCVMFWDIRVPRAATHSLTERKSKVTEPPRVNQSDVPNTFKHLDLSWKPFIKVALPKKGTAGEYSPLKFSLRDNMNDKQTGGSTETSQQNLEKSEGGTEYALLRASSAKQLKPLEDISTRFYVGTEDGEVVYTDWKMEKDNDSGRLLSTKPSHRFLIHDGFVNSVRRSPFFKDIILTVGGWTFAIWKEGVMNGPIIHSSCSPKKCTVGYWSPSRPGVFFIGKEDGNVEVWDLLEKTHEASQTQNLSTTQITCIKPWIVPPKQHLLAVSDHSGTLHILEVPWSLCSPSYNEKSNMAKYFEKEVDRLIFLNKRMEMRAKEKKDKEAEEQQKKMEPKMPEKLEEQIEEENLAHYMTYLAMEKVILKNMGLLSDEEPALN
ncbi:dynein axonemal intermediate chain 3-like isoform X1 [Brienomyrus brachyistius]|uniref:dynein axonemal intermediate chain 3-like isoform X1 n=1 Tax=Brienomyrus brachyistius TaxID=42636 RepID=UPI0020B3EFDF|nr:dynein axonemal intermediate chain 3-like isoform X1 [Brienomyrus brachyistius]XP_048860407.1 dynein axonemal intermediate chain 3-like isoform X1 [Brienomyrus brachyistius]